MLSIKEIREGLFDLLLSVDGALEDNKNESPETLEPYHKVQEGLEMALIGFDEILKRI